MHLIKIGQTLVASWKAGNALQSASGSLWCGLERELATTREQAQRKPVEEAGGPARPDLVGQL